MNRIETLERIRADVLFGLSVALSFAGWGRASGFSANQIWHVQVTFLWIFFIAIVVKRERSRATQTIEFD